MDNFQIDKEKKVILCHSRSGNTYRLSLDADEKLICTCNSFLHREKCRHVQEAQDQGLVQELLNIKTNDVVTDNLFVVCYAEHENRLIVNSEQLITVLDNAKKHNSKVKVFKLGEKVIDWD